MLPKSNRLTTELVTAIVNKGRSFHSSNLSVRLVITSKPSRFSVSVPKKVLKTAVSRNKLKRRVYTIVRNLKNEVKAGYNAFIIAKPGLEKLNTKDLSIQIKEIFVKSGILK